MTREQDAQIFLGHVYDVTEALAVDIESGEISVADARVTCLEGIAFAFGLHVEISMPGEAAAVMARGAEAPLDRDQSGGTAESYLQPRDVAKILGVSSKTLARWADSGEIETIITLGGHRRYRPKDVKALAVKMGIYDSGDQVVE